MLIPIGDDVNKRTWPIAGFFIIALNLLAYLYEYTTWRDSQPEGTAFSELITTWGLVPADLANGRVVGLFTHMFLHGSLMHLAGNMVTLWLFVPTLESALGSLRFCLFYVLWGIAAGLAQAGSDWGSDLPVVGASGGISGVVGAYLVTFGPFASIRCLFHGGFLTGYEMIEIKIPAGIYVFFWLVVPNLIGAASAAAGVSGVAWYAHLGGLFAGAVMMRCCAWDARRRLTADREGKLEVRDGDDLSSHAIEEIAASGAPATCPYCQQPLGDDNKLDSLMFRCPNEACQRLILLSDEAAVRQY